ncbi:MAG: S41 family peptidase [Candidatus Eisenbacteria bacterium]
MSRLSRAAIAALTVLLVLPCPLVARSARAAGDAPPPLDARARTEIINGACAELERTYVEADTAKLIANVLRRKLAAGAYDRFADRQQFAESVTADLRSLNGDLHLSLRPAGAGAGPGGARRRIVMTGAPGVPTGAGGSGPVIVRSGPGGAGGRPIPGLPDAREHNFGLERAEILSGNIGYLEVTGFNEAPGSDDAMAAALRFLERTDAMIIDVRRNGGGSGAMSHLLFSHFLGAEPVPTIRVTSRATSEPRLSHSVADVPGPRRPDVPLYVLTSARTGSAAEEFSFVLHNLGRATLVGQRTAGAGHMVNFIDVPRDFVLGVSITRVADPRTGAEWEAVGVPVDRPVDAERALVTAQTLALQRLAESATEPERKRRLEWAADWVSANAQPQPAPDELSRLAGKFSDDREISLLDGKLIYHRGSMSEVLRPLSGDRYMLTPEARFVFDAGSPAPGFTIERLDGSRTAVTRQ